MESHPHDPWVCRSCGEVAPRGLAPGEKCPRDATVFVRQADLASQPDDPVLGQVVGGKFAIVGLIGVGGFGAVYRAIQTPVGRVVAVKVIRPQPDATSHDQLRARFFREARVVARLSDPATVTLYDYGEKANGRLYMVFEYIDGVPLSDQLKGGPLAPERVPPLLFQMLGALAEAHRLGCVHRDLKPGNVMLARSGFGEDVVKVLDFGIAKVTAASDTDHSLVSSLETCEGVVIGTPKYMAPEQARGLEVDLRADIYALGCLTYAMLTGKPPFDFNSAVDVLMAQVAQAPPPFPASLGVPERLASVVFRALAKDPADRFQSAEEMARAIVEFTPGLSATMEQSLAQAPTPDAAVRHDTSGTQPAPPPRPETGEGGTSREMAGALATFSTDSASPAPHLLPTRSASVSGAPPASRWPPPRATSPRGLRPIRRPRRPRSRRRPCRTHRSQSGSRRALSPPRRLGSVRCSTASEARTPRRVTPCSRHGPTPNVPAPRRRRRCGAEPWPTPCCKARSHSPPWRPDSRRRRARCRPPRRSRRRLAPPPRRSRRDRPPAWRRRRAPRRPPPPASAGRLAVPEF